MPRRNRQADLEFEIHEDDTSHHSTDETTDARDFVSPSASAIGRDSDIIDKLLRTDGSTLLNEKVEEEDDEEDFGKALPNSALDSNITRASTLVDDTEGPREEPKKMSDVDGKIAAMLEDLGAGDARLDSASSSRRESGVSNVTHDRMTDRSVSRRVSAMSASVEDVADEDAGSRRSSRMTDGTRRSSGYRDDSVLDNGDENGDDGSASRRVSFISNHSNGTVERNDISSQVDNDEEQNNSTSRRESAHSSATQDDSDSRRESAVSSDASVPSRRASKRTEAMIHAAARDIVDQINLRRGRASDNAESLADEQGYQYNSNDFACVKPSDALCYVSNSKKSSARQSDTHESLADEGQSYMAKSKVSSARPSDAHESIVEEQSYVSDSRVSSARPSDAHELVDERSHVSDSRVSSARPSDAHESIADDRSYVSNSRKSSARPSQAHESAAEEQSSISNSRVSSARPSDAHESLADYPRPSVEDVEEEEAVGVPDEGAESSSHNENEDDVFSDHSPRSSVGSMSETEPKKMPSSVTYRSRSPRMSGVSEYSRLDDNDEDFIPTVRGTPRPAFRSPSSVKALQMSSPPPSVLGSPRSSRRTPLPTVSRLGSPSLSAQYSPKKTPPRFKRATPPLVLLHATLLPLRWPWGDVLENARTDELTPEGKNLREAWRHLQDRLGDTVCERGILLPHPQNDFEVLEERLLEALELPLRRRARILECGHYLGPSNEMTILEEDSEDENTNEASRRSSVRPSLETKMHWCTTCRSEIRYDSLGAGKIFRVKVYASNGLMKAGAWEACWKEMERVDVELEPILVSGVQEELGRLASEQEKALELQQTIEEEETMREEPLGEEEPEASYLDQDPELEHEPEPHHDFQDEHHHRERSEPRDMPSSPPVKTRAISSPAPSHHHHRHHHHESSPVRLSTASLDAERRKRDEVRLREIYGHTPPAHPQPSSAEPSGSEYRQHEHHSHHERHHQEHHDHQHDHQHDHYRTPPSPSAEAYARREERRQTQRTDSLPELLLEAFRVAMQDRRNVAMVVMSALVLYMAYRGGANGGAGLGHVQDAATFQTVVKGYEVPTVTVTHSAVPTVMEEVQATIQAVSSSSSSSSSSSFFTETSTVKPSTEEVSQAPSPSSSTDEAEPSKSPESAEVEVYETETVVSQKIVRVVETITEKVFETATVTETQVAQHTETVAAVVEPVEEDRVFGEGVDDVVVEEEVVNEPVTEQVIVEEPALEEQIAETVLDEQIVAETVLQESAAHELVVEDFSSSAEDDFAVEYEAEVHELPLVEVVDEEQPFTDDLAEEQVVEVVEERAVEEQTIGETANEEEGVYLEHEEL